MKKLDNHKLLHSIRENLELLMKNPRKGSKAASILVYVVLGMGTFPFVYQKLDWNTYNPFMCMGMYVFCALLFFGVGYFLLRTCIKFDKHHT